MEIRMSLEEQERLENELLIWLREAKKCWWLETLAKTTFALNDRRINYAESDTEDKNMSLEFVKCGKYYVIHNYFSPPEVPLIFFATDSEEVAEKEFERWAEAFELTLFLRLPKTTETEPEP